MQLCRVSKVKHVNRKDLYIYIQLYFSPLQKVKAIRGQTALNIHLCYKIFFHVRLVSSVSMHAMKLEKLFSLKPNRKKPFSTEQNALRGKRLGMAEHFYPTGYNVSVSIKVVREEHTVPQPQ